MRGTPSHISGSARTQWLRRNWFAIRIAGCFLSGVAATVFVGLELQHNLIWVANGLLLSHLLLAPRWRWKYYLASGLAAQIIGSMAVNGVAWRMDTLLPMLNIIEVLIGAFLLRRRSTHLPRLSGVKRLVWSATT